MTDQSDFGLHTLSPAPGSRKARKRVGRGEGSGTGKTSGRGQKGYGSRTGAKAPAELTDSRCAELRKQSCGDARSDGFAVYFHHVVVASDLRCIGLAIVSVAMSTLQHNHRLIPTTIPIPIWYQDPEVINNIVAGANTSANLYGFGTGYEEIARVAR